MKRFILNCSLFIMTVVAVFELYKIVATAYLRQNYGITTAEQVNKQYMDLFAQKDSLECVFFGNSRFYRAINPFLFDFCCYNFSHDNDSYNQMYYKLEHVINTCSNLKYVVVECDYVSFSYISGTRNGVYRKYMPSAYLKDYSLKQRFADECLFPVKNLKSYFKQARSGKKGELNDKGRYIIYGEYATENDQLKRTEEVLEIQKIYFERICKIIKDKNLSGFIVVMPYRDCEYLNFSEKYINKMNNYLMMECKKNSLFLLDYSRDQRFMDYKMYTDHSHLNQEAGDYFSKILNGDISSILENKTMFNR